MFFDNMAFINKNGLSIFIDVDPYIIANRLSVQDIEERPLFSNIASNDLTKELIKKLERRKPYYQQAQYTIQGNNLKVENLLDLLKRDE